MTATWIDSAVVVDTNVAVVANGDSGFGQECRIECSRALGLIMSRGCVAIDDRWLILKEYCDNVRVAGQPGPGSAFLKWLLSNLANPNRCHQVSITPTRDGSCFREVPADLALAGFDPADRKFIAVAASVPGGASVLEATDSKWWDLRDLFVGVGLSIVFLCPREIQEISARRARPGP